MFHASRVARERHEQLKCSSYRSSRLSANSFRLFGSRAIGADTNPPTRFGRQASQQIG
jgi:hypothetical protein